MYKVLLYYYFSEIADPEDFCQKHRDQCRSLNLFGRIYIAAEGINGTVAGTVEQAESYKTYLTSLPGFEQTEFKEDECDHVPFIKLIVKTRPEIVSLRTKESFDVPRQGGVHLSPREWAKVLESKEDITLIDVRNDYETKIGHFEGAICPDEKNFYDFPRWVDQAGLDKNKKVLMYCTGGIRCEKFSAFMKEKGFKDVNQLHGGIINYAKKMGDAHYKGKCFVFDDRLSIPIEENQKEPLARCEITQELCDTYLNCGNPECNRLFLCSPEGSRIYQGCCCEECMKSPRRKPYNPDNIYEPTRKWYQYFDEKPTTEGQPEIPVSKGEK